MLKYFFIQLAPEVTLCIQALNLCKLMVSHVSLTWEMKISVTKDAMMHADKDVHYCSIHHINSWETALNPV